MNRQDQKILERGGCPTIAKFYDRPIEGCHFKGEEPPTCSVCGLEAVPLGEFAGAYWGHPQKMWIKTAEALFELTGTRQFPDQLMEGGWSHKDLVAMTS